MVVKIAVSTPIAKVMWHVLHWIAIQVELCTSGEVIYVYFLQVSREGNNRRSLGRTYKHMFYGSLYHWTTSIEQMLSKNVTESNLVTDSCEDGTTNALTTNALS